MHGNDDPDNEDEPKQTLLPGLDAIPDSPNAWKRANTGSLKPISSLVNQLVAKSKPAPKVRKPGASTLRVIETAATMIGSDYQTEIAYQHTVLCQTCLPYRNPGDDVLSWQRDNGFASLLLKAGEAHHPSGKWVQMGLPFGPKPRLVLAYLNTQAILKQSPMIDVEDSLSGFLKKLKLDHKGQNLKTLKEQLMRLAASDFRIGVTTSPTSSVTHKGQIVSSFDLWMEKDARQRVMWSRNIQLDERYFNSLVEHAVPLDANALATLAHSAMALDVYAWLGQRLHRVHPKANAFIPWTAMQTQFGEGFTRIRKFREKFNVALKQVKAVYPEARFNVDGRGLTLQNSKPPIAKQMVALTKPTKADGKG